MEKQCGITLTVVPSWAGGWPWDLDYRHPIHGARWLASKESHASSQFVSIPYLESCQNLHFPIHLDRR